MNVKQTERTVRAIRRARSCLTLHQLARIFHTCESNIHYIVTRATWRHVA